jgi:hypothetical protein
MGITNFDQVSANAFIGPPPQANPFGVTYYVDTTNGADSGSNDGKSTSKAFATLTYALSRSLAGDNFIIAPGTYTHTATFSPLARQSYRAAVVNARYPTVSITATSALTGDLISLDVAGCSFYGIQFLAGDANQATLVDIADTADVNGAHFHSCVFNGADKTTVVGIQMDDATFIPTGIVVENCLFRDLTGTIVDVGVLGMAYALFRNNFFALDVNSGTVFALADTSAYATGKGFEISNNNFLGFDATKDEVAITIAGTEDTTAAGIITNNRFGYFAVAAVTIDKMGFGTIQNYTGDATGGLLTDVGT